MCRVVRTVLNKKSNIYGLLILNILIVRCVSIAEDVSSSVY